MYPYDSAKFLGLPVFEILQVSGVMTLKKGIWILLAVAAAVAVVPYAFRTIDPSSSGRTVESVGSSTPIQVEPSVPSREPATGHAEIQADIETKNSAPTVEHASPIDWMNRFRDSADYWELANEAVAAAVNGDARAQYALSRALGECNTQVELYRRIYSDPTLGPEQIIEMATASKANRSSVSVQVLERGRQDFMKCARFFSGPPRALSELQLGLEAESKDYWRSQALENNDPLAHLEQTSSSMSRLKYIDEDTAPKALESIRAGLTIAAASADPEAWFQIGNLVAYAGSSVSAESAAWVLAACESGYDCSYSNPLIGNGCISAGNCAAADTLVLQMQRELGTTFGEAYARSQEILFAFETGDSERVVGELLDRIDLGE
jgi:hypothetical protein